MKVNGSYLPGRIGWFGIWRPSEQDVFFDIINDTQSIVVWNILGFRLGHSRPKWRKRKRKRRSRSSIKEIYEPTAHSCYSAYKAAAEEMNSRTREQGLIEYISPFLHAGGKIHGS